MPRSSFESRHNAAPTASNDGAGGRECRQKIASMPCFLFIGMRWVRELRCAAYCPSTQLKISGATIVASDSTRNFGVLAPSLPQVIFSFGTAPE